MQNGNSIQNYEQIRAKHAYNNKDAISVGAEGGRAVAKKFPAMIIGNGFLGALAFAEESGEGLATVAFSVIDHLEKSKMLPDGQTFGIDRDLAKVKAALAMPKGNDLEQKRRKDAIDAAISGGTASLGRFIDWLAGESADKLRSLTTESLAYLNYLRRFASPGERENGKEVTGNETNRS